MSWADVLWSGGVTLFVCALSWLIGRQHGYEQGLKVNSQMNLWDRELVQEQGIYDASGY